MKKVFLLLTVVALLGCNRVDFMGVKIDQPSDSFFEQLAKSNDFFVDETSAAGVAYDEPCLIFKSSHMYDVKGTIFWVYFPAYDDFYILARKLENIRENLIERYGKLHSTPEAWRQYESFKEAMNADEDLIDCLWKFGEKTIRLSISGPYVHLRFDLFQENKFNSQDA